jgi:hypothetical protein
MISSESFPLWEIGVISFVGGLFVIIAVACVVIILRRNNDDDDDDHDDETELGNQIGDDTCISLFTIIILSLSNKIFYIRSNDTNSESTGIQ